MLLRVGSSLIQVEVDDHDLLTWLTATLSDLAAEDGSASHRLELTTKAETSVLRLDDTERYSSIDTSNVVDHLVSWCNQQAVASRPEMVNLHAAGLTAPETNRCVVLPGIPGSGKSSISAAACARGWGYLSDEMVSLDHQGLAHSYPKPITIKLGAKPLVDIDFDERTISDRQTRWYVRPTTLGGQVAEPTPVHAFVFATFDPKNETGWQAISTAQAVLDLARNCQDHLDAQGQTLLRLAAAASQAVNGRLSQRDLGEAMEALDKVAAASPPAPGPVQFLGAPTADDPEAGPRVAPDANGVAVDGGVVVHQMSTQKLVVLDPLAGAIWQLLDGTTPEADLAAELAEAFDHDEAEVAADIGALLDELRAHGLITGNL